MATTNQASRIKFEESLSFLLSGNSENPLSEQPDEPSSEAIKEPSAALGEEPLATFDKELALTWLQRRPIEQAQPWFLVLNRMNDPPDSVFDSHIATTIASWHHRHAA